MKWPFWLPVKTLSFEAGILSDVAPLNKMIASLLDAGIEIRFMRDITRGGVATILAEIASGGKFGIEIEEEWIPIREQVKGLCEIYGFNPLYLANEGKVLLITSKESAFRAVEIMKQFDTGAEAGYNWQHHRCKSRKGIDEVGHWRHPVD